MDGDPNFSVPSSKIAVPVSSFSVSHTALILPAKIIAPGFPPANVQLPLPATLLIVPAQTLSNPEQNIKVMGATICSRR
jgi:hypothetical protein